MNMKIMTCQQLGGACEKEFYANNFEEMVELSKQHGMEMFQEMMQLMQRPEAMKEWFESKREEFEALPDID
jgi:predicted small metal-binding protein